MQRCHMLEHQEKLCSFPTSACSSVAQNNVFDIVCFVTFGCTSFTKASKLSLRTSSPRQKATQITFPEHNHHISDLSPFTLWSAENSYQTCEQLNLRFFVSLKLHLVDFLVSNNVAELQVFPLTCCQSDPEIQGQNKFCTSREPD